MGSEGVRATYCKDVLTAHACLGFLHVDFCFDVDLNYGETAVIQLDQASMTGVQLRSGLDVSLFEFSCLGISRS